MSCPDPHGRVALMLCESLLHVLVERGMLTKANAIEAIDTVADLTQEMAEDVGPPAAANHFAVKLVEAIAQSFAIKDNPG